MPVLLMAALFISVSAFGSGLAELKVVDKVDLNRYIGKWYEIAAFPQFFQKGCFCSTAEYQKTDKDYIRVINRCRNDKPTGKLREAKGKAFIVPNTQNAKLLVQFFWPFKGKYWIIELADDYSYAMVGHPNRKYLWILARTSKISAGLFKELVERARKKGFDISKLKRTDPNCP